MSEETVVKGEADRAELVEIINELHPELSEAVILDVLNALPECVAIAMHRAGPDAEGLYRFEGKGLFVARLKLVAEGVGHGVAEGVVLSEHYSLHLKAAAGFERAFEAHFNLPVTG